MVISLNDILIIVYILVGIALIAVLWRLFTILTDLKDSSVIIARRTKEIDSLVGRIEKIVENGVETIKGLVTSLDFIKGLKNKFMSGKGDKDEE